MNHDELVAYVLDKSRYFNMKAICELANVNYSTFRGWKNNGYSFSDAKLQLLVDAMKSVCKD